MSEESELDPPDDLEAPSDIDWAEIASAIAESMSSKDEMDDDRPVYQVELIDTDIYAVKGDPIETPEDIREDDDIDEDMLDKESSIHRVPDYNDYLNTSELVAGDSHHIEFTFKNVSENTLPEGKFKDYKISPGLGKDFNYPTIESPIPETDPGEEFTITSHLEIGQTGDLTIRADIELSDGGQLESGLIDHNTFGFGVRGVARESLLLLDMVDDIRRKLE